MTMLDAITRTRHRYRRFRSRYASRRMIDLRPPAPIVSFTFDDFPHSAWVAGGAILARHGALGTFYASLGLLDQESDSGEGRLLSAPDVHALLAAGHELGCHTCTHGHAWDTAPSAYERSLLANRTALAALAPGARMLTHAYPISGPRPATKRVVARHFRCARGGGQTLNRGPTDANNLNAFFLEQAHGDAAPVQALIARNARESGWLIFATHDVRPSPGRYGCTPAFLDIVVQAAAASGARLMPVAAAWEHLAATGTGFASNV